MARIDIERGTNAIPRKQRDDLPRWAGNPDGQSDAAILGTVLAFERVSSPRWSAQAYAAARREPGHVPGFARTHGRVGGVLPSPGREPLFRQERRRWRAV